jgi:hypothetical protein
MSGLDSLDLEVDAAGPRLKFGLWHGSRKGPDFTEKLALVRKVLNLAVTVTRRARRGVPSPDSTEPSALEHDIDAGYKLVADEEVHMATIELAEIAAQIATMSGEIVESAYASIQSDLDGTLTTNESQFAADIAGPMKEAVDANTGLKVFDIENESENEPTHRSLFQWAVSALIIATAESLVNSFMFHSELGFLPGAGFSFVVGLGFAAIGTAAGIGVSQLRRKQGWRRIVGAVLLVAAVGFGFYFLTKMGYFRTGLEHADAAPTPQPTGAVSPYSEFTILPFLLLNVVGMTIIGAKAVPMFGYLDLRRLRANKERTEKRVNTLADQAFQRCDVAQQGARRLAEGIAAKAQQNAAKAEQLETKMQAVHDRCARRVERCADAAVTDQLRLREIVIEIQAPAVPHQRFRTPPPRIHVELPAEDQRAAGLINGLAGRATAMRDALADVLEKIDAAANASRERISEILSEAELSSRPGRVAPNIVNFRR